MWPDAKSLRALSQLTWYMMSDEQRDASLQRKRAEHDHLIDEINSQFAVVTDGPHAGKIVSTSTGAHVSQDKINALFLKHDGCPVAQRWLRDPRRREMSGDELRKIIANRSTGS